MLGPTTQSWHERAVHWFRYRFDIGYRIQLELAIRERAMGQGIRGANGEKDLFGAILRQLNEVEK